ncbi:MAG: DUF1592 domain-containing protein [Planctomycetota bacterium]
MPASAAALFEAHCLDCHDEFAAEGGVDLETLDLHVSKDIKTAEVWQKVLNVINSGEMPPPEERRIPDRKKADFLEALSKNMVTARKILSDSGGEITIRRLNRREYARSLEALLHLTPNVDDLPADDDTGGFDTSGASLYFSSEQFELYHQIASDELAKIARIDPRKKPRVETVRIEAEIEAAATHRKALDRLTDGYERAKAFQAQKAKPAKAFGFSDAAGTKKAIFQYNFDAPQLIDYFERPETKRGATLIRRRVGPRSVTSPPVRDTTYGRHTFRFRVAAFDDAPERLRYIEYGVKHRKWGEWQRLGQRKVTGTLARPQTIEVDVADLPWDSYFVVRQRWHNNSSETWREYRNTHAEDPVGPRPFLWVDWIEREGPFHDSWPPRVFRETFPDPSRGESEEDYVSRVLTRFAERAFRGDRPSREYIEFLVDRYSTWRRVGRDRAEAVVDPMALILSSPGFLYMAEPRSGEEREPLSDRELAVRLSYFLWSAPPDRELMTVAERGRLSDPAELGRQVDRMLADERVHEFVESFAHQWLDMGRLDQFQFHPKWHPTFDTTIRLNARKEIYAMIRTAIDEGLSVETLLDPDYLVLNDVMADYYGIDGVSGHEFRRVDVPRGSPRGGLLGTAAVHIMGSDGRRSSPVERGVWVLRHLLHDPPPPAPANVPQLSRLDLDDSSPRTLQRLHMEQPQCAQCHRKIDPIGFGLENFDAAGLWRDKVEILEPPTGRGMQFADLVVGKEFGIQAAGTLPDGTRFRSYEQLRREIENRDEAFARGFCEALIAYGLGRPFGFSDEELAAQVLHDARREGNTFSAFVRHLVVSDAFRSK